MSTPINIGVIGAGAMGSGIAQVAATAGHEVIILDSNPDMLERAKANLNKILARLVEKEKITMSKASDISQRIVYSSALEHLQDCSLVIEAIVENLKVKKQVFADLEKIVKADCILATNTSSLSVAAIASACENPERVIGVHFFNPAPLMPLVEIVPAVQTKQETVASTRTLIDSWGKISVLTKDTPGFIVNRVARPFYGEALRILEEGIADIPTIDWAITELGGFRMGPFTLMDFIGNDINYTVTETVFHSFYCDPRYKPSFTQKRLSEAGYLGRKSGKGFYDYSKNATQPKPSLDKLVGQQVVNRILIMLINEAADALFWNIATKEDIDLAMTKGVNYPVGLLKWADDIGIENCVRLMDQLHDEYLEDRYRCSPQLRKMVRDNKTFY